MAITGRVDFTSITSRNPDGIWSLIGEDGKHYVGLGVNFTSAVIRVGCAETNTVIATVSEATWKTDVLSLGGGLSGNYEVQCVLPIAGTPYVGALGVGVDNLVNDFHVVCAFYKINSSGALVFEGDGFGYLATTDYDLDGAGDIGVVGGTTAIDGELLFTTLTNGTGGFVLARVPYTGTNVDLSPASWDDRCTTLPWPSAMIVGVLGSGRNYGRFTSLKDLGDGHVGVFLYRGAAEGGPDLFYTDATPVARTTTGDHDVSADFGIPFADTTLLYDGTAGTQFDEYTAPSINGDELTFLRVFTDNIDTVRARRFTMTDGIDSLESIGQTDISGFTIVSVNGELEQAFAYRDGDDLLFGLRDRRFVYFYQQSFPIAVEGECGAEDEPDALATAIIWPKCVLVPGSINVDVVPSTVSPGRTFTGEEQIVQADPGFWRIRYGGIPIRTKAHALQWRETESGCNGRNNPIMVPVYEAPLSGVPIVAVAQTDLDIGVARIGITQTAGADIRAGMHFSDGTWLYRVKRVLSSSGGALTVNIFPPLRAALSANDALDFNDPMCRCRLSRDNAMDVDLELLRFASPTVSFDEDV